MALALFKYLDYGTVQYSIVQYSTVQYSTIYKYIIGLGLGVLRWATKAPKKSCYSNSKVK